MFVYFLNASMYIDQLGSKLDETESPLNIYIHTRLALASGWALSQSVSHQLACFLS